MPKQPTLRAERSRAQRSKRRVPIVTSPMPNTYFFGDPDLAREIMRISFDNGRSKPLPTNLRSGTRCRCESRLARPSQVITKGGGIVAGESLGGARLEDVILRGCLVSTLDVNVGEASRGLQIHVKELETKNKRQRQRCACSLNNCNGDLISVPRVSRHRHLVGLTAGSRYGDRTDIFRSWGCSLVPMAVSDLRSNHWLRSEKSHCGTEGRGFDSPHLHRLPWSEHVFSCLDTGLTHRSSVTLPDSFVLLCTSPPHDGQRGSGSWATLLGQFR